MRALREREIFAAALGRELLMPALSALPAERTAGEGDYTGCGGFRISLPSEPGTSLTLLLWEENGVLAGGRLCKRIRPNSDLPSWETEPNPTELARAAALLHALTSEDKDERIEKNMDEDELMEDELRCPLCGKKAQDGCEHIIYAYDGVNNELTDYSEEWRDACIEVMCAAPYLFPGLKEYADLYWDEDEEFDDEDAALEEFIEEYFHSGNCSPEEFLSAFTLETLDAVEEESLNDAYIGGGTTVLFADCAPEKREVPKVEAQYFYAPLEAIRRKLQQTYMWREILPEACGFEDNWDKRETRSCYPTVSGRVTFTVSYYNRVINGCPIAIASGCDLDYYPDRFALPADTEETIASVEPLIIRDLDVVAASDTLYSESEMDAFGFAEYLDGKYSGRYLSPAFVRRKSWNGDEDDGAAARWDNSEYPQYYIVTMSYSTHDGCIESFKVAFFLSNDEGGQDDNYLLTADIEEYTDYLERWLMPPDYAPPAENEKRKEDEA